MNLIVCTDLGRDPDDFFALCYLHSIGGVNIRAITISPGDEDQIAIAKFFCKEVGLNIPIGSDKMRKGKRSSGGIHYDLLKKYKHPLEASADGYSQDIIRDRIKIFPECEVFACGPLTGLGRYLESYAMPILRLTVQGGFLAYDLHKYNCVRLEKFEGKTTVPTFNLNGDPKAALTVINSDLIFHRKFVSKNVCHTVVYDKDVHSAIKSGFIYRNRASDLFIEAMDIYLSKHTDKKFHDPTAAVCHMHPEIATWVDGNIYRDPKGNWGTVINENLAHHGDKIIADIDRHQLWHHIACGT